MLKNKGKVVAHDADRHRLRPIFERITRAGATNIDIVAADEGNKLDEMGGFDCVLIDAPCSGSGSWRRKPDAKWRLAEIQLKQRIRDQREVLEKGAALVKDGGRRIYITCSVLPEENAAQVEAFLKAHKNFEIIPYGKQWAAAIGLPAPESADGSQDTLLLTPARHGTDGFFIAVMRRT